MAWRSEGVHRLGHVAGALLALWPLSYVLRDLGQLDGLTDVLLLVAILLVVTAAAWLVGWSVVVGCHRLAGWVRDGFKQDQGR